jgi:hypothetical protein
MKPDREVQNEARAVTFRHIGMCRPLLESLSRRGSGDRGRPAGFKAMFIAE